MNTTGETVVSSLSEFLLARIAEDEDVALTADRPASIWSSTNWSRKRVDLVQTMRWSPERVLAECDAKRRIVRGLSGGFAGPGFDGVAAAVLADLALPYADHADYRDEWAT